MNGSWSSRQLGEQSRVPQPAPAIHSFDAEAASGLVSLGESALLQFEQEPSEIIEREAEKVGDDEWRNVATFGNARWSTHDTTRTKPPAFFARRTVSAVPEETGRLARAFSTPSGSVTPAPLRRPML
jgi:hypothetical protein